MTVEQMNPPPEAVECLGCPKSPGNRTDCKHKDCKGLDGCLFDDCPGCEGDGYLVP